MYIDLHINYKNPLDNALIKLYILIPKSREDISNGKNRTYFIKTRTRGKGSFSASREDNGATIVYVGKRTVTVGSD